MIRSDGVRVRHTHRHTHTHVIIHIIIPTTMIIMRDRITTCGENRIKNIKKVRRRAAKLHHGRRMMTVGRRRDAR